MENPLKLKENSEKINSTLIISKIKSAKEIKKGKQTYHLLTIVFHTTL